MSSYFGEKLRLQIFGQSHSEAVGVVLDGLPPGEGLDMKSIDAFLERRRGGKNAWSTPRAEADLPEIVSGVVNGATCGAPLCATFANANKISSDYDALADVPRPSHADLNARVKYKGAADQRGGGHFSGRLTLPLCFAGAVCLQILERRGVRVGAHIYSLAGVRDKPYDPMNMTEADFTNGAFPARDPSAGEEMIRAIADAAADGDSVGGIVECAVLGLPQGVGEPMFGGLENRLAAAVFGIPAVKGIEFGAGFAVTYMRGSDNNDGYYFKDGQVKLRSNHAGGIVGGIASGAPLIFRAAFKPTPSISREQGSVNLRSGENVSLRVSGRHDPCIVPRAVPCVEAAAAVALLDAMMVGGFV